MAELKTKQTKSSVAKFFSSIKDEDTRNDCLTLARLMTQASGSEPKMWGTSIVGFGSCHLRYPSGRELDWFITGFSPRKQNLTLYIMGGFTQYGTLLTKLGKHSLGKGCLYIKRLDDVHLPTLKKLILQSVKDASKTQVYA